MGPVAELQAAANEADTKGWAEGNGWSRPPGGVGGLSPWNEQEPAL